MNILDISLTPYFGIIVSIIAFEVGLFIYKKTKFPLFNPLLIAIGLVISFLYLTEIDLDTYNIGGSYISFFLWPATVALAIPLYKRWELLKKNIIPVLGGVIIGSFVAVFSVLYMSWIFGLDAKLTASLIPKSVTTPIGVELTKQLGGFPPVTVVSIVFSGIIGAILSPLICKIFRIKDKIAIGISIGTASHALGTTKALELGETEGAMSGLAIGLAGLITVLIIPIAKLFL